MSAKPAERTPRDIDRKLVLLLNFGFYSGTLRNDVLGHEPHVAATEDWNVLKIL